MRVKVLLHLAHMAHTHDIEPDQNLHNPKAALVWSSARTGTGRQIIDEWERLAHKPMVLRRVNGWDFMPHPVNNLDEVLELCGFGKPVDDTDADELLWHLVRHAETDELAARIVLHRVMPSIMNIAVRRGRIVQGGVSTATTDAISTAWMVIRTFPHQRRRHKIAANIVRDIEYHGFFREKRLVRVQEIQVSDYTLERLIDNEQDTDEHNDFADILVSASEMGVEQKHTDLLARLASGTHSTEIAAEWGVSPRTVRNFRRHAVNAVRDALLAEQDV